MMNNAVEPTIVEKDQLALVGFSFFGDPFKFHGGWSEENEIGRLWTRFMAYLEQHSDQLHDANTQACYEVHIEHEERHRTGAYEIFVGIALDHLHNVPIETVVKFLPATTYAVFTFEGEQIVGDWPKLVDAWIAQTGHRRAYPYEFQYYDERFKGMHRITESVLDVYVPIKKTVIGGQPAEQVALPC